MKKTVLTVLSLGILTLSAFAGTIQGYVTDAYTNEPVENARVHLTTNDGNHIWYNAYTDANGFYSKVIPNDTYNGRAQKMKEYMVTLIEGIEINDGVTTVDFEIVPTDGNHYRNKFGDLNLNPNK